MFAEFPGGFGAGDTPVPIPNTEVKTCCADGTAWATAWESRTPPGLFSKGSSICVEEPFLFEKNGVMPVLFIIFINNP